MRRVAHSRQQLRWSSTAIRKQKQQRRPQISKCSCDSWVSWRHDSRSTSTASMSFVKPRANDDPRLDAVDLPTTSELREYRKNIKSAEVTLNEATTEYGNGNFRTAFDMLNGVDGTLQQIEYGMAQAEIAITQAMTETSDDRLQTLETETPSTD